MEYANLGTCLPGFNEFFDFEVGDVFMYDVSYGGGEGGTGGLEKKKILDVTKRADSLILLIDYMYRPEYYPYEGNVLHEARTEIYLNSNNHYSNTYPKQKIRISSYNYTDKLFDNTEWLIDTIFIYTDFSFENSNLVKKIGYQYISDKELQGPYIPFDSISFIKAAEISDHVPSTYFWEYGVGLGSVKYEFEQFESWGKVNMIGYIKNGVKVGTVYSDSFMTAISESTKASFSILPNPASEYIEIVGLENKNISISLYDIFGKLIKYCLKESNNKINISDLDSGIYFLRIDGINQSQKFIKH